MAQNRPRQKNEELHAAIQAFFTEVHEAFSYLESEYLYGPPQDIYDEQMDPRDLYVYVGYRSRHIIVCVAWWLGGENWIDVDFVDLQAEGWSPSKIDASFFEYYPGRRISLQRYAEMLGQVVDPDFLLKDRDAIMGRKARQRERTIQAGTKPIVEGLARATRKYAGAILLGDTSMFEKVRQYTHDR